MAEGTVYPPMLGRLGHLPMRVDHEFIGHAGIETPIAIRRLVETDHLDVDDLGDGKPVPQNRLHQLPVVLQHRRLARVEAMRFGPAKSETKTQTSTSCGFLFCSRIFGHIKAGDADGTGSAGYLHEAVE